MNNRMIVMTGTVLAVLISSLDTTIINTTMPKIAEQLGGFQLYAWTFASYMIVSTVLAPLAGRLADLFGRKKVFAAGIALFLLGSLLCGLAQSMVQLVLFRGVQGIGAGVMLPLPAIIAGDLFSVEKRGKIQGIFSVMWGGPAVTAPVLGAFFVEVATWRWIFYVNIPVCILALLLLIPYKEAYRAKRAAVDFGGAFLFALATGLLLVTTVVEQHHALYFAAGAALLALFIFYERRHVSPLVPFSVFSNRAVAWMIVNAFVACASLFGTSSYIPLYLQNEGYSLFASGLALLGSSLGWMAASSQAGRWIVKYGYRPLLIAGNGLLVLSGALLVFLPKSYAFAYVFATLAVQGAAFGTIFTVTVIGAQQMVAADQKGISTSLQMFARNIGTAIGVTIMGAFLTKAPDFATGIHRLFTYGLLASLLALAPSFSIAAWRGAHAERLNPGTE